MSGIQCLVLYNWSMFMLTQSCTHSDFHTDYLHKNDSHSSKKVLVFSRPWVSLPQCSMPKWVKSRRMSRRSLEEMSQCLFSLISVKIHGLIRAPLQDTDVCHPPWSLLDLRHTSFQYLTWGQWKNVPCHHYPWHSRFSGPHGIFPWQNVSITCAKRRTTCKRLLEHLMSTNHIIFV